MRKRLEICVKSVIVSSVGYKPLNISALASEPNLMSLPLAYLTPPSWLFDGEFLIPVVPSRRNMANQIKACVRFARIECIAGFLKSLRSAHFATTEKYKNSLPASLVVCQRNPSNLWKFQRSFKCISWKPQGIPIRQ